uniref:J domain-containing protein n=1 Tax=Tetraselmis chuii TaxID=63592 RepID=A0A7S1SXE0_9CHLO|mmetsp:Transcript_34779/g.62017  ORF Transcript_34779/g.62017 Transcript_34779/m.62017 type:complete len:178 (+) Transcript_34779:121-654(+)
MATRSTTKQQELLVINTLKARDHYEVLQVGRSASQNAIKRSYRDLALQLHPDKNQATGSDEAFKVATAAYNCLSDPTKRSVYDRWALGQKPVYHAQSSGSRSAAAAAAASGRKAPPPSKRAANGTVNVGTVCRDAMLRCCCIVDGPDGQKRYSWPLAIVDSAPLIVLGIILLAPIGL